ncbi:hypothetical protein OSJ77_03160 [Phyllobacterium sp. 0TCS1.6C]|uniref:hypothetical protein n=1 Tax=unclassified Phyllobacterium TaxID=2638441 RepID=UPI002263D5B2|nr:MULTISPECIES: hypothetical protein [unclassified Phyllobacterium]MCX8279178.1 hypothetical protein [Phyllobacterium sp. 0TCS1.6C]MCX8293962.1 hypothetical protein [Phyllobacterium sp. 0TCS1.6A]
MTEEAEKAKVNPESRTRLDQVLSWLAANPEMRVYAGLEGALFDDLPSRLAAATIAHRSLYRGDDYGLKVGGPWLADLYYLHPNDDDLYEPFGEDSVRMKDDVIRRPADPNVQLASLMQIVTDSRAAVFWVGDADLTDVALYRHLRTINQILIPRSKFEETAPERVTFRHADANVMAQVTAAIRTDQCARLLGPARSILFTPHEEWGGGLKRVDRPRDATASVGPLALDTRNVADIEQSRFNWLTARTVEYLRKYGKERASAISEKQLETMVRVWLKSALGYRVTREPQLRKWCYMQLFTQGNLETVPGLHDFMMAQKSSPDPNERVDILMRETTKQLKEL